MNKAMQPQAQPPIAPATGDARMVDLRILATSDLHMQVTAYDYSADRPSQHLGLSRTAALIHGARNEVGAERCILVDNGDFLQGNALGDFVASHASEATAASHPMIAAMNHLGYDAVNLGNHEFSHGIAYLQSCLAKARFPCIGSNTWHTANGAAFVTPWVIIERELRDSTGRVEKLRVGLAGVLPPQTSMWDSASIAGRLRMGPMRETLAQVLPELRAAGADVIVVLAHCGIGTTDGASDPWAENLGAEIARLPHVDAIVMGHVHLAFPQPASPALPARIPAVMAGAMGSHLGVIDLRLSHDGTAWRVVQSRAEARPIATRNEQGEIIASAPPDPAIEAIAAKAHSATLDWMRRPVARIDRPLHSYFALVSACPAVEIVNQAKIAYVTRRLAGTEWQGLPVLSCNSPARAGARGGATNYCHIPAGDFLHRHATEIDPHPNSIVAMRLTGAELVHWLEHSARVFRRIGAGAQDEPLLCSEQPPFNFDTIGAVTYRIDISAHGADAGAPRISDLRDLAGRPIGGDEQFILAMSSYRASGSGGFAASYGDRIVLADSTSCRDILVDYLRQSSGHLPKWQTGWRFAPVANATVIFESAPEAADHLGDVPHLQIEPLDLTSEGFRRYRLYL